jgi:hypothetical protein
MRLKNRTLRRAIRKSALGMLFRERKKWRRITKKIGKPLAASPTALIIDRKDTKNSQSLKGLTKYLTVMRGEMRERGVTECHQHILQTLNLLTMAMFSPPHLLPVLIRCTWTITGPQKRTMSPLFHTRSLEEVTVMPFRTD